MTQYKTKISLLFISLIMAGYHVAVILSAPSSSSSSSSSSSRCPPPLDFDDVASRTLLADVVFVGTLTTSTVSLPSSYSSSYSSDNHDTPSNRRGQNATFPTDSQSRENLVRIPEELSPEVLNVTFQVERIYKGQILGTSSGHEAQPTRITVGAILDPGTEGQGLGRGQGLEFPDIGADEDSQPLSDCAGLAEMREGVRYIVFLKGIVTSSGSRGGIGGIVLDVHWSLGKPEVWSRKEERVVILLSCSTCSGRVPKASITESSSKSTVLRRLTQTKLILTCEVSGNPPPHVTWYKNSALIGQSEHVQINNRRMVSELVVQRSLRSDSGVYWCRATNVLNSTNSNRVRVNVSAETYISSTETSLACSEKNARTHCLNGGTCYMTRPPESMLHCRCPLHYEGPRCGERTSPAVGLGDMSISPLTVIGITLAVLILAVLVFIAFFLARFILNTEEHRKNLQRATPAAPDDVTSTALLPVNGSAKHSKQLSPGASNPTTFVEIRHHSAHHQNSKQTPQTFTALPYVTLTSNSPDDTAGGGPPDNQTLSPGAYDPLQRRRSRLSAVSNVTDVGSLDKQDSCSETGSPQQSPDSCCALIPSVDFPDGANFSEAASTVVSNIVNKDAAKMFHDDAMARKTASGADSNSNSTSRNAEETESAGKTANQTSTGVSNLNSNSTNRNVKSTPGSNSLTNHAADSLRTFLSVESAEPDHINGDFAKHNRTTAGREASVHCKPKSTPAKSNLPTEAPERFHENPTESNLPIIGPAALEKSIKRVQTQYDNIDDSSRTATVEIAKKLSALCRREQVNEINGLLRNLDVDQNQFLPLSPIVESPKNNIT